MQRLVRMRVGGEFQGWKNLENILDAANNPRDRLLALTLFKTAGRIGEVLSLTLKNFDFDASPISIVVRDMPVEKKFFQVEHGGTEKVDVKRTFPILKDEELSQRWSDLLCEGKVGSPRQGLPLFPGEFEHRSMNRFNAYRLVTEMGKKVGVRVHNHWFRDQRIAQLKDEYLFRKEELDRWVGWGSRNPSDMADKYGKPSWRNLEVRMLIGRKEIKEATAAYE